MFKINFFISNTNIMNSHSSVHPRIILREQHRQWQEFNSNIPVNNSLDNQTSYRNGSNAGKMTQSRTVKNTINSTITPHMGPGRIRTNTGSFTGNTTSKIPTHQRRAGVDPLSGASSTTIASQNRIPNQGRVMQKKL